MNFLGRLIEGRKPLTAERVARLVEEGRLTILVTRSRPPPREDSDESCVERRPGYVAQTEDEQTRRMTQATPASLRVELFTLAMRAVCAHYSMYSKNPRERLVDLAADDPPEPGSGAWEVRGMGYNGYGIGGHLSGPGSVEVVVDVLRKQPSAGTVTAVIVPAGFFPYGAP